MCEPRSAMIMWNVTLQFTQKLYCLRWQSLSSDLISCFPHDTALWVSLFVFSDYYSIKSLSFQSTLCPCAEVTFQGGPHLDPLQDVQQAGSQYQAQGELHPSSHKTAELLSSQAYYCHLTCNPEIHFVRLTSYVYITVIHLSLLYISLVYFSIVSSHHCVIILSF